MGASAIVLCGGKSTRMGRAKAWLPWNGVPMVAHVVARLRSIVDEVVIVSSKELELPPLDGLGSGGVRIVRDREPALGPLSGIREGLAEIRSDLAFVTGTDVPLVSRDLVHTLLAFGDAAAVEVDGHIQTLAAVYTRSGLATAEALMADGRLRPLDLLEALDYQKLSAEQVPDVESVRGFNTPAEYLAAVRESDGSSTATLEFFGRARLAMGRRELEVPVGTLGELLARMEPKLSIIEDGAVSKAHLVSLDGREFVRDVAIPIGPGERAVVLDASVGG